MNTHSANAPVRSMSGRALALSILVAALGAATFAWAGGNAATPADDLQSARALSRAFQRVARQAEPCVVHLTAIRKVDEIASNGWISQRTGRRIDQPVGFGSGVIVDSTGVILTNNHVVEPGETYRAKLADGREFSASLVGRDPMTDLAVVRISDGKGESFPAASLGDSDSVEVGDWVIAIGSPFGFTNTVTTGIVSAKSRSGVNLPGASEKSYQDFIQTDAAINPGNSGGPLLDLDGKVVGINSAIATRAGGSEGIGFAIPVQIAKSVMDSILKSGRVVRGYVGVDLEEISPARLHQLGVKADSGVLVRSVVESAPAATAGLKPDDIIIKYNGRPMSRVSTLRAAIAVTPPGTKSSLEYIRDGKPATTSVEIADANLAEARLIGGLYVPRFAGAVQTIDAGVRRRFGAGFGRITGVVVLSVEAQGQGQDSGFQESDIIVSVDDKPVRTAEEFRDALDRADAKEPVRLGVIRNRMRGFIDLIPE
ncbi:MAG: trypsin-like peptidase domain-containing protein [Phycisphaerales bacterium]|nr:trypsin-like peptidase domain-containing protein [Planctomycetota bacterium]